MVKVWFVGLRACFFIGEGSKIPISEKSDFNRNNLSLDKNSRQENMKEKIPQAPTDVPVAEAKVEGTKMEWGPELGKMNWEEAKEEVEKLNEGLEVGEMLWRLPGELHLLEEFKKTGSTPAGFNKGRYWTATQDTDYPNQAYYVDMSDGSRTCIGKFSNSFYVRPIRRFVPKVPNYQI